MKEGKLTFADIRQLVSFAKKHRIEKLKFQDLEFEFNHQAFLSKREQSAFQNLLTPTPESKLQEAEDDLYYSAGS